MSQHIGALTLLVVDYDQAIRFFTEGLGFALLEDTRLDEPGKPGKRWVRVAPKGASGSALLLAKAANAQQQTAIGQQGGGRVLLPTESENVYHPACHKVIKVSQKILIIGAPIFTEEREGNG